MKPKLNGGFTIIETVVVACLFVVVLSLTLSPWPKNVQKHQFEKVARELVADIRFLQQRALAESNSGYDIRFRSGTGSQYYELRQAQGNQMKRFKIVYLPAGIEFSDFTFAGSTMTMTPKGTSTNPGTIALFNRGLNKFLYVKVAVTTGRVRMTSLNANLSDEK